MRFVALRPCAVGVSGFNCVRLGKVGVDFLVGDRIVHKVAGEIFVIRGHVDESVARKVEKYHLFFARLEFLDFTDGGCDRMA